jgi:2-dehydropantoate 2-reductase
MRIAVMAAGAVGGYFGARLAAAGHDVAFIARGAHLDAIRRDGLKVESTLGNLLIKPANVSDDPNAVGPVDIVLFAVKLWDTEKAGGQARPLIGERTRLITFQNGIDAVERLAPILGADRVAGGAAYIATVISAPGVISHTSPFARIRFGRSGGKADPELAAFAETAAKAGIDVTLSDNIDVDLWKKFVFLVALSGATAATRQPVGPIRADPDTRAFFHDLMREVVAVARARKIDLPLEFVDEQIKFGDAAPEGFKASMLHDLERGNRLELDWLSGKVVELGRQLGVATPANEAVYRVLKLHRMGRA